MILLLYYLFIFYRKPPSLQSVHLLRDLYFDHQISVLTYSGRDQTTGAVTDRKSFAIVIHAYTQG